jgi:hypothetical protein
MRLKSLALVAALTAASTPAPRRRLRPGSSTFRPSPTVIVEPDQPRSTLGILLPLALAGGLIALAIASEDDSTDEDEDDE